MAICEIGPTASESDADLAAAIGVDERVVTSFRAGVADWKVMRHGPDALADAMGVSRESARAALAVSRRKAFGRRNSAFGVAGR